MVVGPWAEECGLTWLDVKQGIPRETRFVFVRGHVQSCRVGLTFHKPVPQPDVSSNDVGGGHLSPCG